MSFQVQFAVKSAPKAARPEEEEITPEMAAGPEVAPETEGVVAETATQVVVKEDLGTQQQQIQQQASTSSVQKI